MKADETCAHYCGDEDCPKCEIYGILVSIRCKGCTERKSLLEEANELYERRQQNGRN